MKKKPNISGHIRLALLSVPLSFVSHYSAFFFVRGTDTNAKHVLKWLHCLVLAFETFGLSVILIFYNYPWSEC